MASDEVEASIKSVEKQFLFPASETGIVQPITDMGVYFTEGGVTLGFAFGILNGDYLFSNRAKFEGRVVHLVADKLTIDLLNLYLDFKMEDLKVILRHDNFEAVFNFADKKQLIEFVLKVERWSVGGNESRFEVVREIDKGSFGMVKLVKDSLKEGKLVTLKTIPVPARPAREGLKAIFNEVSILRRIRHPNVLKLHSVLHVNDQIILITEFIEGGTLDAKLKKEPLGIPEALEVVKGLVMAVRESHRHAFVHRDVKPANVMC